MTEPVSDEFFRDLRNRRPDAFKQLYQQYKLPLYHLIDSFLHDRDRSADIIQDAFLQAIQNIHQLENPQKLKTWLFRIAVNLALNCLKREKRIEPAGNDLDDLIEKTSAPHTHPRHPPPDPDELCYAISLEIPKLPLKQQAPFIMKYLKNMKETEIAEILDIPVGTVKSRLNAARAAIRLKTQYPADSK